MKKFLSLIFISALATLLVNCNKLNKLTQFEIEYTSQFTIPSSAGANFPFNVSVPPQQTNAENKFESNDTRKDKIQEIKLTKLDMVLKNPTNGDFSFLNNVAVYIKADGLDEILLAYKNDIESTAKTITLITTGCDLKEYIKKDNYTLRVNVETDEVLFSDHDIDINTTFFIDAKVL